MVLRADALYLRAQKTAHRSRNWTKGTKNTTIRICRKMSPLYRLRRQKQFAHITRCEWNAMHIDGVVDTLSRNIEFIAPLSHVSGSSNQYTHCKNASVTITTGTHKSMKIFHFYLLDKKNIWDCFGSKRNLPDFKLLHNSKFT